MYAAGLSYAIGSDFFYGLQKVPLDDIQRNQILLLYFTASWCPASQRFNEVLFKVYHDINLQRKSLEVIVVSKERTEADYRRYTAPMNCILVPYDPDRIQDLFRRYQVKETPVLILLKRDDGSILTRDARTHIETEGPRAVERWRTEFFGLVG